MDKLVSIITPCHNAENTLAETIESVIAQTYTNWEMLIIDDCSTDHTEKIARQYAAEDKRIRILKTKKPSGSPAEPRNIGLDHAKGTYIAFLDSDDIWLPYKLMEQIKFMEMHNYDIVYSYYEKMNMEGIRNNRIVRTSLECTYSKLLQSNHIPILTSISRRNVLGSTRFRNISQEDFCFWLDILKKGHKAYNFPEVTAIYRVADKSRSRNKFNMMKGFWKVLRDYQHVPFLKASGCIVTYTAHGFAKFIK